jgi:hypothetical protein
MHIKAAICLVTNLVLRACFQPKKVIGWELKVWCGQTASKWEIPAAEPLAEVKPGL